MAELDPAPTGDPPTPGRTIVRRSQGSRNGPITRLMSPGDFGALVKPFVFLDLFEADRVDGPGFAPHPHSGIATLTTFFEVSMTYGDSTGKRGAMSNGSVEWMRAGRGVWHSGRPEPDQAMRGYQLWLALPPELELAPAESLYLEPNQIESAGPARVLLGRHAGVESPISLPMSITYLHVRLENGERWTYVPGSDHDVAWLALSQGRLHTAGSVLEREMAVFSDGYAAIELVAEGDAEFVIGSAAKHSHPLVIGHYSVHTSENALTEGERNIEELRRGAAVSALY